MPVVSVSTDAPVLDADTHVEPKDVVLQTNDFIRQVNPTPITHPMTSGLKSSFVRPSVFSPTLVTK